MRDVSTPRDLVILGLIVWGSLATAIAVFMRLARSGR